MSSSLTSPPPTKGYGIPEWDFDTPKHSPLSRFIQNWDWSWLPWVNPPRKQLDPTKKSLDNVERLSSHRKKPVLTVDAYVGMNMHTQDMSTALVHTVRASRFAKLSSGVSLSFGNIVQSATFSASAWTTLTVLKSLQFIVATGGSPILRIRTAFPLSTTPKSLLRLRFAHPTRPQLQSDDSRRASNSRTSKHLHHPTYNPYGDFVKVEVRAPPGFFAALPPGRAGLLLKTRVTPRIKVKVRASPRLSLHPANNYHTTVLSNSSYRTTSRTNRPVKGSLFTYDLPGISRRLAFFAEATVKVKYRCVQIG